MKYYDLAISSSLYKALSSDSQQGRLGHAYMLVSPDMMMLELIVNSLIASDCSANLSRRVLEKKVPDVRYYPVKDKITVADIDDLTARVHNMPSELNKCYYIIIGADTMAAGAANKLLKTLEEPPSSAVIFLLCGSDKVLPTIKSRCRIMTLDRFAPEVIDNQLQQYYPASDNRSVAAIVSSGLMGVADAFASSKKLLIQYELSMNTLLYMRGSKDILKFAARWASYNSEDICKLVEYSLIILRDLMMYLSKRPQLMLSQSNINDIITLASLYNIDAVIGCIPKLEYALCRLSSNDNIYSIVDEVLFAIAEVRAKCQKS